MGIDINLFKTLFIINESAVYIAMSKAGTNLETVERWKKAFADITEDGTLNEITTRWQIKILQDFNITSEINNGIIHF
jgi:ABC-type amino acid transport substrate-binding protein